MFYFIFLQADAFLCFINTISTGTRLHLDLIKSVKEKDPILERRQVVPRGLKDTVVISISRLESQNTRFIHTVIWEELDDGHLIIRSDSLAYI